MWAKKFNSKVGEKVELQCGRKDFTSKRGKKRLTPKVGEKAWLQRKRKDLLPMWKKRSPKSLTPKWAEKSVGESINFKGRETILGHSGRKSLSPRERPSIYELLHLASGITKKLILCKQTVDWSYFCLMPSSMERCKTSTSMLYPMLDGCWT